MCIDGLFVLFDYFLVPLSEFFSALTVQPMFLNELGGFFEGFVLEESSDQDTVEDCGILDDSLFVGHTGHLSAN